MTKGTAVLDEIHEMSADLHNDSGYSELYKTVTWQGRCELLHTYLLRIYLFELINWFIIVVAKDLFL